MKKILSALQAAPEKTITYLVVLSSIVLTTRLIQAQHGWVTDDTVLYFELARLFALGEWKQGLAIYQWPLYPALITLLHKVSSLSIHTSAQILGVMFFALVSYSFVQLIRLAGGSNVTVICGTLLLFGSQYIVGDVLPMLIRDQGFWAFFLTSLVFFIKFYRVNNWFNAIMWQLMAIVAMLFRLEAITYLAFLPLILVAHYILKPHEKALSLLKAYSISIVAASSLAIALLTMPSFSINDLGRLREVVMLFEKNYLLIVQKLADKAALMNEQVLGRHLDDYGLQALILTLGLVVVLKTIQAAGWLTVLLLFIKPKPANNRLSSDAKLILYGVAAIALINACLILTHNFVLTSRYVIALAFILMLLASFNLANLFHNPEEENSSSNKLKTRKSVLGLVLITMLMLSLVINILPKPDNYNYEQDAVAWLKKHSADSSKIFYVSPRARYYAGAPYEKEEVDYWVAITRAINDDSIHSYDYLVLNIDKKQTEHEQQLAKSLVNHQLIKEFQGFRGKKRILIYQKINNKN